MLILLTQNRKDQVMRIPYTFVMVVFNHRSNFTQDLRDATVKEDLRLFIPQNTALNFPADFRSE